jgi:hypothetical protein
MTAIWNSFVNVIGMILAFIPRLVGFLVVLLVGWLIAKGLERALVWLLNRANFEAFSDRMGMARLEERMNMRVNVTEVLGRVVFWFVLLIFLVPAVDSLGLPSVSLLLGQIIAYIPNVFVAILVLFLGTLLGIFVGDLVRGLVAGANIGNPNIFSAIARYAIIGFAAIIALYQLNIAPAIVQTLFTAIVGAAALAFGLAFGLGGRETAQRWLDRGESRLSNMSMSTPEQGMNQPRMEQQMGPARTAAAMPTDEQLRTRTFTQQPYGDQPRKP